MTKKLLICGLIFFSILFASTLCVSAADEKKTFTDDQNDVIDVNEVKTSQKPNIDIVQIDYSKTGKAVTLALHVKGNIENRGDINDTESLNFVYYELEFHTNENDYDMAYVNKASQLVVNDENGSVSSSVDGSALTFNFDLIHANESYSGLYVSTADTNGLQTYFDDYSNESSVDIIVNAGGPYSGVVVGQSVNFSGSAIGGTGPYTWAWTFGGEGKSYTKNATHTFDAAGTYKVILNVTDTDGNPGTASVNVTVSESGISDGGKIGGNDNSESSNSGLILFVVIIAIIVIAGIAVVVYIIRR